MSQKDKDADSELVSQVQDYRDHQIAYASSVEHLKQSFRESDEDNLSTIADQYYQLTKDHYQILLSFKEKTLPQMIAFYLRYGEKDMANEQEEFFKTEKMVLEKKLLDFENDQNQGKIPKWIN